ncbi:hypothetical protein HJC23_012065 [Cyclotella cryptica]|uniref:Cryptochrome DASH n=1 Tax=Cyclotella cryptica TaxID=29204 RepID=A0ABD3PSG2_9STRA|eukprot:CCRYP_011665-RA/>CCRYP_011665-RA protein AED:0.05 eAED:0.04 QI:0/-1/0/1/-1/1/1/0/692
MSLPNCLRQRKFVFSIGSLLISIKPISSLLVTAPISIRHSSQPDLFTRHPVRHFGTSLSSTAINDMPNTNDNPTPGCLNIHWFRQTDLRLHDNPALCRTVELSRGNNTSKRSIPGAAAPNPTIPTGIVPLYIFDSRLYGSTVQFQSGERLKHNTSIKVSARRAQFLLESIQDLRHHLETRGSGLVVALGEPEQILGRIVAEAAKSIGRENAAEALMMNVVCQEEVCSEELAVEKAVRASIAKAIKQPGTNHKFNFETVWGSTMYDPNELPFDNGVYGIPDTFTPFRNKVEKNCDIGVPLDVPADKDLALPKDVKEKTSSLATFLCGDSQCSLSYMPSLADLGYSEEDISEASAVDSRSALPENYRGGESFALQRVKEYIWTKDLLKIYFDTRNGMIGSDYSTKFAPWLALGNVSPRYIARECAKYEEQRVQNKSTYWVVFELLWRDYFKFFAKKHGDRIFYLSGTAGYKAQSKRKWGMDPKLIQAWRDGMTGYPLVDANMRELKATGFMSNRGRQNVASFLAIDMNMDWRYGAWHFEELLLDYDVHSNWGNWCSAAGMTGGRLNRFNIVKQSKDYDFGGEYVRLWCPELKNVPDRYVHSPWEMSEAVMKECGVKIGPGRDYPSPIVDPSATPRVMMNDNGGRGGGGREKGGGRGGGRSNNGRDNSNPNRGRGQRQDMKSLKTGSYRFDSKYV